MKQNDKAKLERRRNTGIASNKTSTQAYLSTTEEHRNRVYREEQQWKRNAKSQHIPRQNQGKQEDKNIKMTNKYRKKYWLVYLNSGIYGTHSITQSHKNRMSITTQSRTLLKHFHGNSSITIHCNVHISK